MIKIKKPAKPPKTLIEKGAAENKENCAAYDCSPEDYRSGQKSFKFKNKIYGSKTVKKALLRAQYEKCCYCESKFLANSPGDVEHYRPKGAVKQTDGQRVEHPGYYWLAYEWNNLLVSCADCNRSYKKDLFPLKNPDARARSHHDKIDDERPLFVNPAIDDPRRHIRFRGATPYHLTKVGRETIKGMGLRKTALEERRIERLQGLKIIRDLIEGAKDPSDSEVKAAREFLAAFTRPNAEYSSMVQDFLGT